MGAIVEYAGEECSKNGNIKQRDHKMKLFFIVYNIFYMQHDISTGQNIVMIDKM